MQNEEYAHLSSVSAFILIRVAMDPNPILGTLGPMREYTK